MTLRQTLERVCVGLCSWPGLRRALDLVARRQAVIFMLHRMRSPELGVQGHDPQMLRQCLALMRKMRLDLVSVEALMQRVGSGTVGRTGLVAFSLDDGYVDQAELAGPIFAEFDCPATYFLITGLIDGKLWPWDSRLEHALLNTREKSLSIDLDGRHLMLATDTPSERQRAKRILRGLLKFYPQTLIDRVVAEVIQQAQADLPASAPAAYAPMSWSTVRQLEQRGMRFAPHTVTHGIVSRMDDVAARYEIEHSWQRIREEVSHPQRVFAWPNGRDIDAGPREYKLLKQLGFVGAVTTEYGTVELDRRSPQQALTVTGRVGLPESAPRAAFLASGPGKAMGALAERLDAKYGGYAGMMRRYYGRLFNRAGNKRAAEVDWSAAKRLVFVCRGNICRSVFAEKFARSVGLEAISFGTDARPGSPADEGALRAALRRNIDLRDHRSRRFAPEELLPGDVVLVFDDYQRQLHLLEWTSAKQCSLLGLWGEPQWGLIADPYGRGEAYFDTCFNYIENCVRRIQQRIGDDAADR